MNLGKTPGQTPNLNSMFQGASDVMGNVLTGIGQYGSDALIGGQGRPIPFPFNRGIIAKSGQIGKVPLGSPQSNSMLMDMGMMAGLSAPQELGSNMVSRLATQSEPSLIHPIDSSTNFDYNNPDIWKNFVNKAANSRPTTQIQLEQAAAGNDLNKVGQILDNIPSNDPYKQSMETLFRKYVPVNQNPVAIKSDVSDMVGDFDHAVDLWKGQYHSSFPNMMKAQQTILQEAKSQLTPAEFEHSKGNIDGMINIMQSRVRRLEQ